ncbi:hypothetical protein ALC56_15173 [Trachymyrmex septentrionalis]|uniref:Uncharacterized protein n=1 Tax=Trachymyrmex septentrionalis TaxID=34720 RepID=A0A195ERE8_9HYME|nr:hypothetical protein ALC56_15173 [Trachymyrmex septentrionalis]
MVCMHSEKKHAIHYVIQGSRYANRTNVTIIAVRSKGTRHDCAEKGTRGLSKLSIVSFHSRLKTDPDLEYTSTSTNRWMMSMASHEVEYSTTRGKRSSRWRSKRPTRLEADQLEDGFRLMKNISPTDYTDSKFISCETNPSESLLKIVKLNEREMKELNYPDVSLPGHVEKCRRNIELSRLQYQEVTSKQRTTSSQRRFERTERRKPISSSTGKSFMIDSFLSRDCRCVCWILSKGEKDRTREIEQRSRRKKKNRGKEEKKDNKDDVAAPSRGICPRKRWNSCVRRR